MADKMLLSESDEIELVAEAAKLRHLRLSTDEIVEILVARYQDRHVTRLYCRRLAMGWSMPDLLERLRAQGAAQIARREVARWESGEISPTKHLETLCRVYQTSSVALGFGYDYSPTAMDAEADHAYPHPEGGQSERSEQMAQPMLLLAKERRMDCQDPDRPPAHDTQPRRMREILAQGTVTPGWLRMADEQTRRVAAAWERPDQWTGVTDDGLALWERIGDKLSVPQQGDDVLRLSRLVGQLGGSLGLLLCDGGQPHRAMDYWRTATAAATAAGEPGLAAWVLATHASRTVCIAQQLAAVDPRTSSHYALETVDLVERGRELVKDGASGTSAMLYGLEGIARTLLGDDYAARRAMTSALRTVDRASVAPRSSTPGSFNETWLSFFLTLAALHRRDPREARRWGERCVELWGPGPATMTSIDLSAASLLEGDLEAACAAVARALELPPIQARRWGPMALAHAQWLLQEPFAFGGRTQEPRVRELDEHVRTFGQSIQAVPSS